MSKHLEQFATLKPGPRWLASPMTSEMTSQYYPAFDALRIVLASVVAIGHSGMQVWAHTGDFAVQVFFALSGWLIGGILLRSKTADLSRFYFNRAARIWIPYFVAISILITVSLLKDHITPKWFEFIFYDATFVYNFFGSPQLATATSLMPLAGTGNHFWSICAEEQFYLFAPFLITIPVFVGRSIWFWSLICAIALACPWWGFFGSISLGVLAAVVRSKIGDWQSRKTAMAVLALAASCACVATYVEFAPYRIGAPIAAISIVLLLGQKGEHSRVLTFLGGVSFPMYLNHWIATFAINGIFSKFGLQRSFYSQMLCVILALLIASVLYICIDRVIKTNRDRYFTNSKGTAVAVCGFALVAIGVIGGLLVTQ
ncbi:acyltransferase family protein [Bradyrhizobium lablabi]|uniref:acyltransferase family protein n=1 Tax=Bradyrhizobium lablabi TaxID=722472 RepID=UPI00090BF42E|nr:acyltransferase [Bradyrhizobium lablabi]SHM85742.1 Peptidoglycan/LPS O-acetylase OafA/YrhL, contains acyltransferase and SGNH-hydrolase domains [Bradyrhizobium lablabi]